MICWLKQQYKYVTHSFVTPDTLCLLLLDVFAGQKTEKVISIVISVSLSNYIIDVIETVTRIWQARGHNSLVA